MASWTELLLGLCLMAFIPQSKSSSSSNNKSSKDNSTLTEKGPEDRSILNEYSVVCGDSPYEPQGTCLNFATCIATGGDTGLSLQGCGTLGGFCCTHTLNSGSTMTSRVAFWQNVHYPGTTPETGLYELTVKPLSNTCYIRLELQELHLSASVPDSCSANLLTIRGDERGPSSTICGMLTGYETFVKVGTTVHGFIGFYNKIYLSLYIKDNPHRYRIRLSQIKCSMINIFNGSTVRRKRSMKLNATRTEEEKNNKIDNKQDWDLKKILIGDFIRKIHGNGNFSESRIPSNLARQPRKIHSKIKGGGKFIAKERKQLRSRIQQEDYMEDSNDNDFMLEKHIAAAEQLDEIFKQTVHSESRENGFVKQMQKLFKESRVFQDPNNESPNQNRSLINTLLHQALFYPTDTLTDDDNDAYEDSLYRILRELIKVYPTLLELEKNLPEEDLYAHLIANLKHENLVLPTSFHEAQTKDGSYFPFTKYTSSSSVSNDGGDSTTVTEFGIVNDFLKVYGTKTTQEKVSTDATTIKIPKKDVLTNVATILLSPSAPFTRPPSRLASPFPDADSTQDLQDPCQGTQTRAVQRIAGGAALPTLGNFAPYYGFMLLRTSLGATFFCSVTLISPRYVLTAASCTTRKGHSSGQYQIRVFFTYDSLGLTPRTWDTLWTRPGYKEVDSVTFHPLYDHYNFHYDIAVLRLRTTVTDRTPVALGDAGAHVTSTPVTLMGFGLQEWSSYLNVDQYPESAVYKTGSTITNAECQAALSGTSEAPTTYTGTLVKEAIICVTSTEGTQLCEGDQGGPVVTNFFGGAVLVGIASGNILDCVNPEAAPPFAQYPDLAVRISAVRDFIDSATTTIDYTAESYYPRPLWSLLSRLV